MIFRKKIYYPDNQITKNLHTKGKEWMYLDNMHEYIGFYHKYSNGEVYSETEWDATLSRRLIQYKDKNEDYLKYINIKHYVILPNKQKAKLNGSTNEYMDYTPPTAVRRSPTGDEIRDGMMIRYFLYKRNEPNRIFFEINSKQAKDYTKNNKGVNQYIYGLLTLNWKIKGPEYDIYGENNILKFSGVVDTNRRVVSRYSQKFPIILKVLSNYREFSQYDGYV